MVHQPPVASSAVIHCVLAGPSFNFLISPSAPADEFFFFFEKGQGNPFRNVGIKKTRLWVLGDIKNYQAIKAVFDNVNSASASGSETRFA